MYLIKNYGIVSANGAHNNKPEVVDQKNNTGENSKIYQLIPDRPIGKYCYHKHKKIKIVSCALQYHLHAETCEIHNRITFISHRQEQ